MRTRLVYDLTAIGDPEGNAPALVYDLIANDIDDSILFSLTGCFRPAIRKFMAAHQPQIDELNLKHGLGLGHNRAKSRTQPDAFPEMVRTFKESVLKETTAEQPF
jgi:hypothetical protein